MLPAGRTFRLGDISGQDRRRGRRCAAADRIQVDGILETVGEGRAGQDQRARSLSARRIHWHALSFGMYHEAMSRQGYHHGLCCPQSARESRMTGIARSVFCSYPA
jgi:hypothetical protein